MAQTDRYPIIYIQDTWILDDEPMGTKDKVWVELPDDPRPWLFKFSRVNKDHVSGEHWSEKIAAELASILKIPHAQVEIARLNEHWGSLSRQFGELQDHDVEMVHGNELLSGIIEGYDKTRRFGQNEHTLSNILRVLQEVWETDRLALQHVYEHFSAFIILDALIMNTDRHHENWALFRRTGKDGTIEYFPAPTFDHASSLGRELPRSRLRGWANDPWRVDWYIKRATGAVFLHPRGKRGANPLHLARVLHRKWPYFIQPWIDKVSRMNDESLSLPVQLIPEECISSESRDFVFKLIKRTRYFLTETKI